MVSGERDARAVRDVLDAVLDTEPAVRVDYAEIVDAATMQPVERIESRHADRARGLRRLDPTHRQHRHFIPTATRPSRRGLSTACGTRRDTMNRIMMKSKIHRATITGADLNYVGSITLDPRLMELADLMEHEQVHVLDIDNGARFETYVIRGGPGDVIVNGAAARLVHNGDKVIVISYAHYNEAELEAYEPLVVHVDEENRPTVLSVPDVLDARAVTGDCPDPSRIPLMTDVLVLGSGGAGLSAAVRARAAGLSVKVLTKGELGWSATRYAQGGVAAALIEDDDSPELHGSDTLAAGGGLSDTDAVRVLAAEGPDRVRELMALGADFDVVDGDARARRARAATRCRGSSTRAATRPGPRSNGR